MGPSDYQLFASAAAAAAAAARETSQFAGLDRTFSRVPKFFLFGKK